LTIQLTLLNSYASQTLGPKDAAQNDTLPREAN